MYIWDGPRYIETEREEEFREKIRATSIKIQEDLGENFFRYYKKVFNYMESGVKKSRGEMACFPLPIKFMPWFLLKTDLVNESVRISKVLEFLEYHTHVFSKHYKKYVPNFLWETRKSLLKKKSSRKPTQRFTYFLYREFNNIVLNSVSYWAKMNNITVSQFLYSYITTVNPLLGLIMPKRESAYRKFFVYRNFSPNKDSYDINAFITVNTIKLTELGKSLEFMNYRNLFDLACPDYERNTQHIDGTKQLMGMVIMWKIFSAPSIKRMENKTKQYLDTIN